MSQLFASGGQSFGVSASASVLPMNEYSGLISFRMDWLDLLAVQGNLKSLLQYHSSKASILRCSVFFIVQFSHPYMTTGKSHSVMSNSLRPNELYSARFLCPWDSPGKNTGMGSHSLFQGIFPIEGSNSSLLHYR